MTVAVSALACAPDEQQPKIRVLSAEELTRLAGGVVADIVWPGVSPAFQSYDNLRFQADLSASSSGSVDVSVFVGSTKVGPSLVSAVPGQWHARTVWPLNGSYTVQFKYAAGSPFVDAGGASSSASQRLHAGVRVFGVRFRDLSAAPNSTAVSTTFLRNRVDDLTAPIPVKTSNTIDGIYGDCNGLDKTQWRFVNHTTITVDPECSDLRTLMDDNCGGCSVNMRPWDCPEVNACLFSFFNEANLSADAYVFHVKTVPCSGLGQNIPFMGDDNVHRSYVLLPEHLEGDATKYTQNLAHELMHNFDFTHCDGNPAANDDSSLCGPSECGSGSQNDNLSCNSGTGRELNGVQCDHLVTKTANSSVRWDNLND